ncbi:hypothetical protein [Sphingopyxis sp. MWB1]|uniref:hypothetical protein n=1 Tax=Sphingopyxis sp. MWB1 TaxID=1537715 RepID=UPI00068F2DC7|nr:hypothetical protein [Sphingopyxis sp. MWB1]
MPGSRARLINAARRSMLQRAELRRRATATRDAFRPQALLDRGKRRAEETAEDIAYIVHEEFRAHRVPLTLAAIAGLAWVFREPIQKHAPKAVQKMGEWADGVAAFFGVGDRAGEEEGDIAEEGDEPAFGDEDEEAEASPASDDDMTQYAEEK